MAASDVDTSFYPKPKPPLDQAASVAGLIGQMNQNRLFQQKFQTNLGLSKIYQNAIDPETGQIDMNKVRSMAAGDQSITLGLPQAVQQSQDIQQKQIQIQQSHVDLALKQLEARSQVLGPLVQKGANITQKDIMSAASTLINSGADTAPNIIKYLMDPSDPLPEGGQALADWAQRHWAKGLQLQQQIQLMYGTPQTVNTGQQTNVIAASPLGGVRQLGSMQNQLPPETPTFDAASGQPGYLGPQGGGAAGGAGRYPGTAGSGASQASSGFVPSGPPLGTSEARSTAGAGSGNQLNAARADVANSGGRIFILQKALQGLQGSPTGPGTETINNYKSFLLAQEPDFLKAMGIPDPNKIKSYDEAQKYLTQFAMAQAGALGQGTDEKLATALTGNASTHISNMAAQDVVKANIGLERMNQARLAAFDQANGKPEDYSKFAGTWGRSVDPRAFIVDQMTPKERATMISGMKPSERTKFLNSVRMALSNGLIDARDFNAQ